MIATTLVDFAIEKYIDIWKQFQFEQASKHYFMNREDVDKTVDEGWKGAGSQNGNKASGLLVQTPLLNNTSLREKSNLDRTIEDRELGIGLSHRRNNYLMNEKEPKAEERKAGLPPPSFGIPAGRNRPYP